MYGSSKTYPHSVGLSVAFRQHRAPSHCRFLHGYALQVRLDFEAETLDDRNWVVDFGALKPLRAILEAFFDHKTLVAQDDPHLEWFHEGAKRNVIDLIVVKRTGMECVAELIYKEAAKWVSSGGYHPRVRVSRVEVWEHEGNSGYYTPDE